MDDHTRLLQLRREVDALAFQIATNQHLAGELADHITHLKREREDAMREANNIARRLAGLPSHTQSLRRAL